MFCENCGSQMDDKDQICSNCGKSVIEESLAKSIEIDAIHYKETKEEDSFCIHCGERLLEDSIFCDWCGQRVQIYSADENKTELLSNPQAEYYRPVSNEFYERNNAPYQINDKNLKTSKGSNKSSSSAGKTAVFVALLVVIFVTVAVGVFIFLQGNDEKNTDETTRKTATIEESADEQETKETQDEKSIESEQKELDLAIDLIESMYDGNGIFLDSVGLTDIEAAVSQVEKLPDNSERDELFKSLELARQLLDTREMVYELMDNEFLRMRVNHVTLENALRKIDGLPEEQNPYKTKMKDVYNQAQEQFDYNLMVNEAVTELENQQMSLGIITRENYEQVRQMVDGVKNTEIRDTLIGQLNLIEIAIEEKERQSEVPSVPAGFDVEEGVLHVRAVYNFITQNQSSMQVTQLGNGAVWYEDATNGYAKMEVTAGSGDMQNYSRFYYYENGELIFAFYFRGTLEHRFYITNGALFRWIDEDYTIRDLAFDHPSWRVWEEEVKRVGVR